jgi:hypothetical protein
MAEAGGFAEGCRPVDAGRHWLVAAKVVSPARCARKAGSATRCATPHARQWQGQPVWQQPKTSQTIRASSSKAPTAHEHTHLRVLHKALKAVHKVGAIEWVAADAHHRGLAQALLAGLEDGLWGWVWQQARRSG